MSMAKMPVTGGVHIDELSRFHCSSKQVGLFLNTEHFLVLDMDEVRGNASFLSTCADLTAEVVEGTHILERIHQRLDEAELNMESFGSAIRRNATDTIATVGSVALLANRAAQAIGYRTESSWDAKYHDDVEKRLKNVRSEVERATDELYEKGYESGKVIMETRACKSAMTKWMGHRDEKESNESLEECETCGGLREKEQLEVIADPNLEWIGRGEKALSKNLRLWCTPYGEEKENELANSSMALFRFARLYLHKAFCATTGMLQKLSFIRCAALLHAARIRLEQLKIFPEGLYQASHKFYSSLLSSSGAKGSVDDVWKSITEVSVLIKPTRTLVKNDLSRFDEKRQEMGAQMDVFELPQFRNGRIDGVKALNENMTENYVSLMQNIAARCQTILGEPPVKFAIAGLGSMARKEITLFSDFEHAIFLEDGCHSDSVLEYFRWFAVLFQVIVIGFGETIVPTVCVRSINNLYSSDKSEDCWFYDIFTPCGISFDGMAPHACATPLGRQILSSDESRGEARELIKTPSEMVLYLCPENDLRCGYNLKDLLSCTSFLFGEEKVYENFVHLRKRILAFEDAHTIVKQHADRIIQNPNPQVCDGYADVNPLGKLDAKAVYYRPFAVLIGSLGKIHKVNAIGTFEILEELHQKGALNEILMHKLSYAFAVICEMRARAYSKVQTQRRVFNTESIQNMIGEEADWAIKDMMQYLQDSIHKHENAAKFGEMSELQSFNDDYVAESPMNEVRKWYFCGQYEKAVEVGLEYSWKFGVEGKEPSTFFQFWLFKSYYQAGRPEEKRMYWDDMQRIYSRLIKYSDKVDERLQVECHCIMAEVYGAQKRFPDAYDVTKQWLLLYLNAGTKQAAYRHRMPAIYKKHLIAAHEDIRPGESEIHEFLQAIFSRGNSECTSTLKCLQFLTSKMSHEESEIASGLRMLSRDIISHAREIGEPRLLLKIIFAHQFNNRQWRDAMITADLIKDFPDISCNEQEYRTSQGQKWRLKSLFCAGVEIHQALTPIFYGFSDVINN